MIEIIPNLHPAIVHFPIAFATAAVAFIAVGTLFKNWPYASQCLVTGCWMLWGAALFAVITAVFGWFAFNSVTHDEASHAAMILHRNWAMVALAALLALAAWDVWRWHFCKMPSPNIPSQGFLVLLVAAWLLVTSTAWYGAELVYRHGLGVMSLPKPEGSGHPHEHGAGHDVMPVQRADMPHGDDHAHSHEGATNGALPHDAEPDQKASAVGGVGAAPKKSGHTHAPGTPTHKD